MRIYTLLGLFFILGIQVTGTPGCKSSEEKKAGGIYSLLPDSAIKIIRNTETANVYRLNPKKGGEGDKMGEYTILAKGSSLNDKNREELKRILLDNNTYDFQLAKRGFLFPGYGVKMESKGKVLSILFDFYRKELVFLFDGNEYKEDFDSAEKEIQQILDSSFSE